jgi:hypothetical protein
MRTQACFLLLLGCVGAAGCAKSPPAPPALPNPQPETHAITYPPLGNVTQVEVKTQFGELLHRIEGAEQIGKIVAFVDKQRSGWGTPWAGVPVPAVSVDFHDGASFKGSFGVGPNFFECQREGDFASKEASAEQRDAFLGLIGVDRKILGRPPRLVLPAG